jgi:hypothetical protein
MTKLFLVPKLALAAGLVAGALSIPAPAAARPPVLCPDVYQPVICSDGVVYSNGCYASAAGATGCVPYGDV